ncbi:MAG: UbiA prenyltransferase family protein [Chthonomonas sp.]|nr:UbiA prenyltransferase family protein [Chthonomonas sp.]
MRPKQWTKNLLATAAWVFTGSFASGQKTVQMLLAFVCLCLASSATYALNDVLDAEADRNHIVKKNRPVASGEVSPMIALALFGGLLVASFGVAWILGRNTVIGLGIFLTIHFLYNGFVKRYAVADALFIALAFVQRAVIGALAISVAISGWLLFVTGSLALLLAFAKRRHEYLMPESTEAETRAALRGYSQPLLDYFVVMSATLAALSYGVYVIESATGRAHPSLILTIPFVLFGIFRYLSLVFGHDEGGEPETLLLKDKPLLVCVALYMVLAMACMKFIHIGVLMSAAK